MPRTLAAALLSILTSLAPCTLAAQDFWVPVDNGISGANISSLHLDDDGLLYASTPTGIYQSDDHGENWRQLPLRLGSRLGSTVMAPNGDLNSTTYDSLYSSSDRGESWIARRFVGSYSSPSLLGIDSTWVFYAWDNGTTIRSSDAGVSWDTIETDTEPRMNFRSLNVRVPGQMLMAIRGALVVSTDHGTTWDRIAAPIAAGFWSYSTVEVLPDGTFLVGTPAGLYRSSDCGRAWARVDSLPVQEIRAGADGNVYQIYGYPYGYPHTWSPEGLRRSTDGGLTWSTIREGSLREIVADRSGTLIAVVYDGLVRSTDGGNSWSPANQGLTNIEAESLFRMPDGTLTSIIAYRPATSSDEGASWTLDESRSMSWLHNPQAAGGMVVDHRADGSVITASGLIIEPFVPNRVNWDSMKVWTKRSNERPVTERAWRGEIHADSGSNRYLIAGYNRIYRSSDGGTTWDSIGGPALIDDRTRINRIAVKSSGELFASTEWTHRENSHGDGATFRSTDHGVNWTMVIDSIYTSAITFDAKGTIYATANRLDRYDQEGSIVKAGLSTVLRSTDNGDSWISLEINEDRDGWLGSLAVDNSCAIYLGTDHNGIFRSTDEGRSWHRLNSGLPNLQIASITATRSGYLVVATKENGIFRSRVPQIVGGNTGTGYGLEP